MEGSMDMMEDPSAKTLGFFFASIFGHTNP